MFSTKLIIAASLLLLVSYASATLSHSTPVAFIPITSGPTLDEKKAKIAGIGGVDGIKPIKFGGIGKFGVAADKKKKDSNAAKKAAAGGYGGKKNNKKQTPLSPPANKKESNEKKKKTPSFYIKTPWSK